MSAFMESDEGREISAYLGLTMREVAVPGSEPTGVDGTVPVIDHLRDLDGAVSAGVLLTLLDSIAGLAAGLAVLPDWVVSTNLMMSTARFDHVGPFSATGRVLRAGRRAVVTAARITDDGRAGALVADGVLTSAVLTPAGGAPITGRPLALAAPRPDVEHAPAPADFFPTEAVGDSRVVMPLLDRLRNPWGILHGGATAALVDAAARHVAGADRRTSDVVLHFLAPGRVGPVEARATVLGTRPDGEVVEVSVHDRGADDRRMILAVVTLRPA